MQNTRGRRTAGVFVIFFIKCISCELDQNGCQSALLCFVVFCSYHLFPVPLVAGPCEPSPVCSLALHSKHPDTSHPRPCPDPYYPQYGPPVDMWSVGCIVAELLTRSALFPGSSESDQLSLIFDTVGTPTPQNWPGCRDLPEFDHWRDSVRESPRPSKLRERFSR